MSITWLLLLLTFMRPKNPGAIATNVSTMSTFPDSTTKPLTVSKRPGLGTISSPPDSTVRQWINTTTSSAVSTVPTDTTAAPTTTSLRSFTTTHIPVCKFPDVFNLIWKIKKDKAGKSSPCEQLLTNGITFQMRTTSLNVVCKCLRLFSKEHVKPMHCYPVEHYPVSLYDTWKMCKEEDKPSTFVSERLVSYRSP